MLLVAAFIVKAHRYLASTILGAIMLAIATGLEKRAAHEGKEKMSGRCSYSGQGRRAHSRQCGTFRRK